MVTDVVRDDRMGQDPPGVPGEATGFLIIRTWVEPGSAEPLRFHIRLRSDVSDGIDRSLTVTQAEAASSSVEAWLAEIVSAAERSS